MVSEVSNNHSITYSASEPFPVIEQLWTASLSSASKTTYNRAWCIFQSFAARYNFDPLSFKINHSHITHF